MVGTVKKSMDTVVFRWFSKKVRHVCEGGLRRRAFADACLANVNPEFEKFAVDARRAPKRVLAAHLPNQSTNSLRHRWAAALAAENFPRPKQSKSFAVPRDDGVGFDEAQGGPPTVPDSTKPGPHQTVEPIELRSLHGALQYAKLVARAMISSCNARPRSKNGNKNGSAGIR
jgi:hypothetical protein